jgi:hypothetical protein
MAPTLWIAFGFLAFLVIFLMITVLIKDKLSPTQVNTLRFLTSLCAGFAGGFFTGDALFKVEGALSNGAKFAISGTAGFALFLLVWFTYKPVLGLTTGFNFKVLPGMTFEQTVLKIMEANESVHQFIGFIPADLSLVLNERDIQGENALVALEKLRYLNALLPSYSVTLVDDVYNIEKK